MLYKNQLTTPCHFCHTVPIVEFLTEETPYSKIEQMGVIAHCQCEGVEIKYNEEYDEFFGKELPENIYNVFKEKQDNLQLKLNIYFKFHSWRFLVKWCQMVNKELGYRNIDDIRGLQMEINKKESIKVDELRKISKLPRHKVIISK